jgi:hypothetical protein
VQASAAATFTDNVGVVTHLSYTNTPYYTQFPQILGALQTLGVKHIRDGYYPWSVTDPIVLNHLQLALAGIKTSYVVPWNQSTSPINIEDFAPEVLDMEALEAPNECDVSGGCGGTGDAGVANAVGFLPTVFGAAKELGIPAVGPAFVLQASYPDAGNLDAEMSINNLHIYFGGRNPGSTGWGDVDAEGNSYGSFDWWLDQAKIDGPGMASEITETGYIATPATSTQYTVTDAVEASYIPRTLLLAFSHGLKKTYIYELIDEVSSPGYGLLNSDLSPKPAFNAVKNLLSTLKDSGAFTPGALEYQISGGGAMMNQLLLEKKDGSFWLVVWLEQSSWDEVNLAPIAVTPQNISLTLSSSYKTVADYQFNSGGAVTAFNQPMTGNVAALTVTDQISIIEIAHR